jgi:hypothetical protein
MIIEYLVQVKLTEQQMVDAIIAQIEMEMNDEVPGTEKYNRLENIVEHAKMSDCRVEFDDSGDFVLMVDGIAVSEKFT